MGKVGASSIRCKRPLMYTVILGLLLLLSMTSLLLLAVSMLHLPSASSAKNAAVLKLPAETTSSLSQSTQLHDGDKSTYKFVKLISLQPRAGIYKQFLSEEECDHLINLAKPQLKKSTVVDSATGGSMDSRVRTSSGMFFDRGQDSIISGIEERISRFTFLPIEHGEGIQVLHYKVGQKYDPHFDYFSDPVNVQNGGQRMATVLMYLSDVEAGGETVFPYGKVDSSLIPWWNRLSDCAKAGLSVRPRKGDALLFWSMTPNATEDPLSLHGSCPVIKGDKWSATKWLRVGEFAA